MNDDYFNKGMNFVMIFHHQLFPKPTRQPRRFVCGCGKTLFKANTANIMIANDIGLPWDQYSPSQSVLEVQCHGCKSKYKILYQ